MTSRRVLVPPPKVVGIFYETMGKKLTKEEFIERANRIHGGRYDYSLVEYKGSSKTIDIICPKHGVFKQIAGDHLYNKSGCKQCANEKLRAERQRSTERFITEARAVHGDKYDYSLVDYVNDKTAVTVICPEHGKFQIAPNKHIHRKQGCSICGDESLKSLIFGKGVNDLRLGTSDPCYTVWHGVLQRTICDSFKARRTSYRDCRVCDEWLYLSAFKVFYDAHYCEGYQIDKDLLSGKDNKLYSPETCCFVPQEINALLITSKAARGGLPIGVNSRGNKYEARVSIHGQRVSFGRYLSIEEAFAAYKAAKEAHIKQVAQEYYDAGKIEKRVYDALMRYEVEITD